MRYMRRFRFWVGSVWDWLQEAAAVAALVLAALVALVTLVRWINGR